MINIKDITFAIVTNGSENLGNCYNKYYYSVYVSGNPDDTTYDKTSSRTSEQWRNEIIKMLPNCNAGRWLGPFKPLKDGVCVAPAYIRIDSGD